MAIRSLGFESGFIVITEDNGQITRQPIASVLRALDIPTGLTYSQVASISALANLVVILIRTLMDKQVLNESFLEKDEISLEGIVEAIEAMGGNFEEPTLEDADS